MTHRSCHPFTRTWALALLVAAALLALPASSSAAFPGTNGKLAWGSTTFGNFDIYSAPSTGVPLATLLTTSSVLENEPAWSPDGSQIAYSEVDGSFGNVWVMNADGSGKHNVTGQTDSFNTKPAWSPDGSRIAFFSNRDGDNEIYSAKLDGSDQTNLTHDPASEDFWPAWSPDGTKIAYARSSAGEFALYTVGAGGGGTPSKLTPAGGPDELEPTWSPDGSKIAFRTERDGNAEIYVVRSDGTGVPQNLTQNPAHDVGPSWSPDGTKIAFSSDRAGNEEVFQMPAAGGAATQFTTNAARDAYPDWQPLAAGSATITVRNAERPSTAGGQFDLSVDSAVVRSGAGHGDAGSANVSPGVHRVSEAAAAGTSPADFATSVSCTKNGHADVDGPGTGLDVAVKYGDVEVCTITNTAGAATPAGSSVLVSPVDVSTGQTPLTVTFLFVAAPGVTTLSSSASGPAPPAGLEVDGSYYYLETTATWSFAQVCFPYTGTRPSIVHWVDGNPITELTFLNGSGDVCAEVESLSPFALARPTGGDDTDAPTVTCGSADGRWHAADVDIECTAEDAGSGLADPADARFTLSTSVRAGTEDADAPTGSHEVCDVAGHCTTAGPIGGNKVDRKAPRLTLPAAVAVDATSPAGATVSFTATASDGADPHPAVSCAPASGSRFAIGAGTVRCTATDHVGNTDRGSFTVTVRGAREQLDRLLQDVVAAAKLPPAVKTQLLTQLRSALAQFDPSKPAQRKATCNVLAVFTAAVRLLSGHGVPPAQATQWIADANRIRAVIGCGS